MSVRVKSVKGVSPLDPSTWINYGVYFDASPIYETLEATISISGSYTSGSLDYNYSYTATKSWNRAPIVAAGTGTSFSELNINGFSASAQWAVNSLGFPGDGEFWVAMERSLINPGSSLMDPAHPAVSFILNGYVDDPQTVIGTVTDNDTSEVFEIKSNVYFAGPGHYEDFPSPPADPRYLLNRFGCSSIVDAGIEGVSIVEDTTAWSAAKWRDLRGTYTGTNTDANGITVDISITIG